MTVEREKELRILATRLHHEFGDLRLLDRALTHASRAHEEFARGTRDNESLEFLGDAILGFLVAELLHRRDPDGPEGDKSRLKAQLVSSVTLARRAQELGLADLLRLGRGEERAGGRTRRALWANAFEAVIAALYLDGGFDATRRYVQAAFGPDAEAAQDVVPDYKGALQEFLQGRGEPIPQYSVVAIEGPTEERRFRVACVIDDRVLGEGAGTSKKGAGREAARQALAVLRGSLGVDDDVPQPRNEDDA